MKNLTHALFITLLAVGATQTAMLEEELDLNLTDTQEVSLSDEQIAALEQELVRIAEEVKERSEEAQAAEEAEEEPTEEVIIIEEEKPRKDVRESEIEELLENLEQEQDIE